MKALVLVASAAVSLCGCLPFALPGSRTDMGVSLLRTDTGPRAGFHLAPSASLASFMLTEQLPFDATLGYVLDAHGGAPWRHGATVGADYRRSMGRGASLVAGARGEYLFEQRPGVLFHGPGAAVRFGFETSEPFEQPFAETDTSADGFVFSAGYAQGQVGWGIAAELGARRLIEQPWELRAALCFSFRLPASFGILGVIPFHQRSRASAPERVRP